MDLLDTQILSMLNDNGRESAAHIAKAISLSVPAVLERIRKLTAAGIIEGFTVRVDRAKLGKKLLAFVFVRLEGTAYIADFRERAVQLEDVLECHHMAGEYDYLLKIASEDTAGLEHFLTKKLKQLDGIAQTNTLIVLATLKEDSNAKL